MLRRKTWFSFTDQPLPGPEWILLQTCRFTSFTKTTSSSLQRQRHSELLHTSKPQVGFWRSSVIAESWLFINWALVYQRIHLAVRGLFMIYFSHARSDMHVPQVGIWRIKQTTGFGTISWFCHQCVAQTKAMCLLSLLLFPLREAKIMSLFAHLFLAL